MKQSTCSAVICQPSGDELKHDKTIKIRGNNPILTLKPSIFLHISLTSTLISFRPLYIYNRVSFNETIKIRGNNPILTLKPSIFLHISLTSTLISFRPS